MSLSSFYEMGSSVITYTCGTCKSTLPSTSLLHQHLLYHGHSYHYNDIMKVAFTKYETSCKATQTNTDFFPGTDIENFGNKVQRQNTQQPMETDQSDENGKVYTLLSASSALLKHPSHLDSFGLADIVTNKEVIHHDSVSDISSDGSESEVICNDVKSHAENIEHSISQNDQRTIVKMPLPNDAVKTKLISVFRGDKRQSESKNDFKHETQGYKQVLCTRNRARKEIEYVDDSVQNKTNNEEDIGKQTEYFYGKISLNNYRVQRDRPKGEFYFGERDKFMKVKVCTTWVPLCRTEYVDKENKVTKRGCEQITSCVDNALYTNHINPGFIDDMNRKSKEFGDNSTVSDIGDDETSINSNTLNAKLKLNKSDNEDSTLSISDGVPMEVSHQELDKPTQKQLFHCDKCDKFYHNKSSLEYHMNKHLGKKPYLCQGCGRAYSSKKTLDIHWLHHHAEKQFECSACHIMLPSAARLREHTSTHAGTEEYKHICSVCNKMYKSVKNLREHVEYSHRLKKKECKICSKVFASLKEYLKHRNKCSHGAFVCEICNKTFSCDGSLRRHVSIHTDHRPHECHICHRRFLQKGPYWIHMVKHHDLTKPDLIRLFPDKHADKHSYLIAENTDTLPEFAGKIVEYAENE